MYMFFLELNDQVVKGIAGKIHPSVSQWYASKCLQCVDQSQCAKFVDPVGVYKGSTDSAKRVVNSWRRTSVIHRYSYACLVSCVS